MYAAVFHIFIFSIWLEHSFTHSFINPRFSQMLWRNYGKIESSALLAYIPRDTILNFSNIEIIRVLGKIDLEIISNIKNKGNNDKFDNSAFTNEIPGAENWDFNSPRPINNDRETSIRLYEGLVTLNTDDTQPRSKIKCFLKEILPYGSPFGTNELLVTKKLTSIWNKYQNDTIWETDGKKKKTAIYSNTNPPFPILIGSLKSDASIESVEFRRMWRSKFPRTVLPEVGNLWTVFKWEEACSFNSMRRYPALPQVIEGLDYFNKGVRVTKRWKFVRKSLRHSLESIDFIHSNGYCHNAVNIQSMWMTTTNQLQYNNLSIQIADLGSCQRLADLDYDTSPPSSSIAINARKATLEDFYQLAFVFLEFIMASFIDDNGSGARYVRGLTYDGTTPMSDVNIFTKAEDIDTSQFKQREFQNLFEGNCQSDIIKFRGFLRSIKVWSEGVEMLERDSGSAWKLIMKMLARGSLFEDDKVTPCKITGRRLIRESKDLFIDTF